MIAIGPVVMGELLSLRCPGLVSSSDRLAPLSPILNWLKLPGTKIDEINLLETPCEPGCHVFISRFLPAAASAELPQENRGRT
jgi:hypothetical protein